MKATLNRNDPIIDSRMLPLNMDVIIILQNLLIFEYSFHKKHMIESSLKYAVSD